MKSQRNFNPPFPIERDLPRDCRNSLSTGQVPARAHLLRGYLLASAVAYMYAVEIPVPRTLKCDPHANTKLYTISHNMSFSAHATVGEPRRWNGPCAACRPILMRSYCIS